MTDFHFPNEPDTEPRPRQNGQARNGHAKPAREISTIWADAIEINLEAGGVVDGLIPRTGKTVLYGDSGSGKTFNALDLACHVAAGRPWRGMDVEQGVVVYVAAEGPESVKRRLWAWKRHHGAEHLPVLVVQSSVDLLNGDGAAVGELVKQTATEHGRVALVVVDTLARAMTGNENAPDDMGRFVAACDQIGEAGGAHVLIVHHSGKDQARGARGHSSLRAATDVELEVTNGEAGGCIKVTKSRDDMGGRSFGFRLEVVELGTNAKGRTITTCVALEAEAPVRTAKEITLTPKQRTTLDCLATALADHGEEPPLLPDIPRKARVARLARWQEAVMRYLPSDGPEWRRRQDFNRTAETLQGKGVVRHVDGWCWLPTQTTQDHAMRGSASTHAITQRTQHPLKGAWLRGGSPQAGTVQ